MKLLSLSQVVKFTENLFKESMHAKRVVSIGMTVFSVMCASRLSSSAMGRALASFRKTSPKHAIKQIDRLLGNDKFDINTAFSCYIPFVIGRRNEILVSLDWTEYGEMSQSRIAVNLVTTHGRATPLIWKTYDDSELKCKRNSYEKEVLKKLKIFLKPGIRVTVVADRGFADVKFFDYIEKNLHWDYVIRMKRNTYVTSESGERKKALDWVLGNGRILELKNAVITDKNQQKVKSFVCVKKKGMKEAWILIASRPGDKDNVVKSYSRRFTCEENFRDEKDYRFGLGFKETRVTTTERRDRFLIINSIATIIMTILGAAGEKVGCDKQLRANTVRSYRTHSLFRQGREYFNGVMDGFQQLILESFLILLKQCQQTSDIFAII